MCNHQRSEKCMLSCFTALSISYTSHVNEFDTKKSFKKRYIVMIVLQVCIQFKLNFQLMVVG